MHWERRKCRCIPTGWEVLGAQFGGAEPTLHSDESQLFTHLALQASGFLILLGTGLTLTYKLTPAHSHLASPCIESTLEKSASPTQPHVSTAGGAGSGECWFHVPPWSEPKAAISCQGGTVQTVGRGMCGLIQHLSDTNRGEGTSETHVVRESEKRGPRDLHQSLSP